jgi:hypothetical protein
MRIRITRPWQIREFPFANLDIGRVLDVRPATAMYLFAIRCAEPLNRATAALAQAKRRSSRMWRRDGSVAELRLQISGRWHRLVVELDQALMAQCSFYREHFTLGEAVGY